MTLSSSSLLYKLAYFPNIVYHKERDLGQALIDYLVDGGLMYPPQEKISLCSFFWRLLLCPLSLVFMLVVGPTVTAVFGAIFLVFMGIMLTIAAPLAIVNSILKHPIRESNTEDKEEISLGDVIRLRYENFKTKTCGWIEVTL